MLTRSRVVDDDFNDVEEGTPGELILRGPMVTQGYFDNPKATSAAFQDGWFLSGDIGQLRDGKFYIVDRKKVHKLSHIHLRLFLPLPGRLLILHRSF